MTHGAQLLQVAGDLQCTLTPLQALVEVACPSLTPRRLQHAIILGVNPRPPKPKLGTHLAQLPQVVEDLQRTAHLRLAQRCHALVQSCLHRLLPQALWEAAAWLGFCSLTPLGDLQALDPLGIYLMAGLPLLLVL